ncbi:MAG: GNAT family N-acetyltransferase [Rhizobium sp.]|nr:GNAT family N-acetyltransferase [Rhizobium sp.]
MQVTVAIEPPDQPAVATLLQQSDAVAARLYPGAFRQSLNPATLSRPEIALFLARDEMGHALGCAALVDLGDGTAELKRMIVDPAHAGQGVGRRLLTAILQSARARGYRSVLLEVGIRNVEARRLYESAGFRDRGPFGRYALTPIATFMEIALEEANG